MLRKFTIFIIVIISVLSATACNLNSSNSNLDNDNNDDFSKKVNFAMINDTHGAFTDSSDGYAIGRVDSLLDKLENENGDYIKIANGDILQGSYVSSKTYGLALIESLNLMDFDAFVIGNHEFDWGIDKIAAYKDGDLTNGEAEFPFLGANIFYKGTNQRPDWIEPYTIVNYDGIKVGIIGTIGGYQESDILATNVEEYDFLNDPTNLIAGYAKELRNKENCDVVVLATHDYSENLNKKVANLQDDNRVDAIFCAHTHQKVSGSITRADGMIIPVVQNYDKNESLQEVILNLNDEKSMTSFSSKVYYPSSYSISVDFTEIYNNYADLETESAKIIGTTTSYLSRSDIGILAAKAMEVYDYQNSEFSSIDLTVLNTGGVRSDIDSGSITVAEVFNTFPFENEVYLINAPGSVCNAIINDSYFYTYTNLNNFSNNQVYTIAVIDYVYVSSYNKELFSTVTLEVDTNILMRDIFIEYIKQNYN